MRYMLKWCNRRTCCSTRKRKIKINEEIPKIFYPIISIFFIVFFMWQVFFVNVSKNLYGWKILIVAYILNFLFFAYLMPNKYSIVYKYKDLIINTLLLYLLFLIVSIMLCDSPQFFIVINLLIIVLYLLKLIFYGFVKVCKLIINNLRNSILNVYMFFISPNLLISQINKRCIKSKIKIDGISKKGQYDIHRNRDNSIIALILFLAPILSVFFFGAEQKYFRLGSSWARILLFAIIFRTISRSFEIIIAFGKDCFETKNNGSTTPQQRQILAISSLVENIFNYATVYYLLNIEVKKSLWQSFILSLQTNFFQNMPSIESNQPDQISLLMILQFMTSFTLIIFSIAMYASGNKTVKK